MNARKLHKGKQRHAIARTSEAAQLGELRRELADGRAQQAATSEILKTISRSGFELGSVLEALIENAVRLCAAESGVVYRFDGSVHRLVAAHRISPQLREFVEANPIPPGPGTAVGRAALERRTVHIPDITADSEYRYPAAYTLGSVRSILGVPMVRENVPIGVMTIWRNEVRPFTARQIDLLTAFADQAAIAIENARLVHELQARNRDLAEALEQQTATSEILRVISMSPADLAPVFEAVAANAARLCDAPDVVILRAEGERLRFVTSTGPFGHTFGRELMIPINRGSVAGRALLERRLMQVDDLGAEPDDEYPVGKALQRRYGHRTMVATPLLRGETPLGAIVVLRKEVRPFTDKQLALLRTFADQAAIAIENARLFNETREALDQQKASAEVLQVISGSVADTQPVFDKILESSQRLFEGRNVWINLVGEDGAVHLAAYKGAQREAFDSIYPLPLTRDSGSGTSILERRIAHYPDVENGPDVPPHTRRGCRPIGVKSVLIAPMLWEGRGIGAIFVGRASAGEFSDKEIRLLKTFADQAVIAIQNARLFSEIQQALEHLTATSDVLRVISGSMADASPVFEKILDTCERLFGATDLAVFLVDPQERLNVGACRGSFADWAPRTYPRPLAGTMSELAIRHGSPLNWADVAHQPGIPDYIRNIARDSGNRSVAVAPLVWEGRGIGTIDVMRRSPRAYSENELALLATFAEQAVIAIQNARVLSETREALEQQRASGEVLATISSSIADAAPVFDKILESCKHLFGSDETAVLLVDERDEVTLGAFLGRTGMRAPVPDTFPAPLAKTPIARAIRERRVTHYPDIVNDAGVTRTVREVARQAGYRSMAYAPMIWNERGIGAIGVSRTREGGFADKELSMLQTFADQAVIAIQNARLFHEIAEKSHELEIANQHKSAFLANMSHELRTPLNAVIGFSQMLAARYFGELTDKQAEYVGDISAAGKHLLSLINDILDLSKIDAGRMELETSDFDLRSTLANALTLVRERAQRGDVALRLEIDPALGMLRGDERKLKQVLLNLLSNAVKFTPRGGEVRLSAHGADGITRIAVSDTGVGMASGDQELIFEAFRQVGTSVIHKREGTGLGLALARRFVELHGGSISVESAPGAGSTFTVALPHRHGQ